MLLSSLSILMGAILVPSHYLWLYSTHIVLVCLYLIWSKRLIVLFLTLLSFISVVFSEFAAAPSFSISAGDEVLIDFEKESVFFESAPLFDETVFSKRQFVQIVYFSEDGSRYAQDDFVLNVFKGGHRPVSDESALQSANGALHKGVVTGVVLADKTGPWWQRNLYVKRQSAQLNVKLMNNDSDRLRQEDRSLREQLLLKLDDNLRHFDHWRYSKALLLGQDDLWSERDTWIIRTLGLAHLFVVSGLHTGFMFIIGRMLSRVVWQIMPRTILLSGMTRWHCDAVVVIPLLFAYAYVTHWGEPVVRASIMLSVYLCARMLALKISSYSIITFALWLVLMFDPRAVLSPGLWLSFSMVYLLIGFCQTSTKLSRLMTVQVMLSTASMVLILGWQEAISSVSIFVNVLLIPFAAIVWFPLGMLSCVEVVLLGSNHSYALLEEGLVFLILGIEWVAFNLPLLPFETFSSNLPRWMMLLLVVLWVYQSPLRRGVVIATSIWLLLFPSAFFNRIDADLVITNHNNSLALADQETTLLVDAWAGSDIEKLMFGAYLNVAQEGYLLSSKSISELTPHALLHHDVKWVILKQEKMPQTETILDALGVNWLVVPAGESLAFYFQNDSVSLRHSLCVYDFFLLKSDTCKRVEKLESVLNYRQI